ncbi:MAG: glycoside hydrolase family 2, partial [Planctomycetales bacterium]|nr:glycoside hydrolase family 2 [Planctomycetales bacterium]
MRTRWADQAPAGHVLPEYPRPQMVRAGWQNLNGKWDFAIRPLGDPAPAAYDSKILVPFPVESLMSGVQRTVTPEEAAWYSCSFQATKAALGGRLLLHFGAVDWDATVFVNGQEVGRHQGGFDPFTLDITDALSNSPKQKLVVKVTDPTDHSFQPNGKQTLEPGGIVYTAVTGIWQTV